MVNNKERHILEWQKRSTVISSNGNLEEMVKNELYDLTWRITTEFIISKIDVKENDKIFDAGFGWGRIIHGLKHYLPCLKVEGVELTDDLYHRACQLMNDIGASNVKLVKGNLLDLNEFKANSFDAVYSTRVLHYIIDKKSVLENLHSILKSDGKILIIIPNLYCPYRWLTYKHPLYSILKLRDILEKIGFDDLKWGSLGFIPPFIGRYYCKSNLYYLESAFRILPIVNKIGGLSYVVGRKV